jgi:hypothetical protein
MTDAKQSFLTVYDYGQGGLWAVVNARSSQEIVTKYPVLQVIDKRPSWMNDEEYNRIAQRNSFDIDGVPLEWVVMAMKEQK